MLRTDEIYLCDKNIWNVKEFDTNKLICTSWITPHTYIIDRNDSKSLKNPKIMYEKNSKNNHATDLWLVPGYSFAKCPYIIKRSAKQITIIDVKYQLEYLMYED